MGLTRLTATYRITTPMFCAGGDQGAAELRPASFKGALRFWYRALAWTEYAHLPREGDRLKALRDREDELFGSTRTGQAKLLLSLTPRTVTPVGRGKPLENGRAYLAGQGLAGPDRERGQGMYTNRPAIAGGSVFDAKLLLRAPISKESEKLLRRALIALGLLGGLGARSRRGFGSLTLERLVQEGTEPWVAPRTLNDLERAIADLLRAPRAKTLNEPPFSALSASSRVLLLPASSGDDVDGLLERVGRAFQHFRSYGQKRGDKHMVGNVKALQLFARDHDAMYAVATRRSRVPPVPERAAFGLPHNYFFRSLGERGAAVGVNGAGFNRRASPLLFHVHHRPGAVLAAVVTFLPATFLPGRSPQIAVGREAPVPVPTASVLWRPIDRFFSRLLEEGKGAGGDGDRLCANFPGAVEVPR